MVLRVTTGQPQAATLAANSREAEFRRLRTTPSCIPEFRRRSEGARRSRQAVLLGVLSMGGGVASLLGDVYRDVFDGHVSAKRLSDAVALLVGIG